MAAKTHHQPAGLRNARRRSPASIISSSPMPKARWRSSTWPKAAPAGFFDDAAHHLHSGRRRRRSYVDALKALKPAQLLSGPVHRRRPAAAAADAGDRPYGPAPLSRRHRRPDRPGHAGGARSRHRPHLDPDRASRLAGAARAMRALQGHHRERHDAAGDLRALRPDCCWCAIIIRAASPPSRASASMPRIAAKSRRRRRLSDEHRHHQDRRRGQPMSSRSTTWSSASISRRRDGGLLPTFSGGAHVVVEMRDGDRTAAQSLFADELAARHARIHDQRAARRCRPRRLAVHARPGQAGRSSMVISYPVNLFSLDLRARKHLMIAGGIGITPFMAQTAQLAGEGGNFELHYTCRTAALGTYADVLRERYGRRVHALSRRPERAHRRSTGCSSTQPLGTHLYVCGPAGMIDWVRDRAASARLAARDRALRAFRGAAARPALRRDAGRQRQDDPRRRAAEPARSDRGGRRRSALSLPRRRLRPVRDQCHLATTASSCTTTTG